MLVAHHVSSLKLTPTQADLVARVRAAGGLIERWPGGFWTTPGCSHRKSGLYKVPDWWVGTGTIKSLVGKGVLTVSREQPARFGAFPVEYRLKE